MYVCFKYDFQNLFVLNYLQVSVQTYCSSCKCEEWQENDVKFSIWVLSAHISQDTHNGTRLKHKYAMIW